MNYLLLYFILITGIVLNCIANAIIIYLAWKNNQEKRRNKNGKN
jgi:hypothetical protein